MWNLGSVWVKYKMALKRKDPSLFLQVTASQWSDRNFSVPVNSHFLCFIEATASMKGTNSAPTFSQNSLNPDGRGVPSSIQLRWAITADVSWSVWMSQSTLHGWFCLGSSGMLRACAICWGVKGGTTVSIFQPTTLRTEHPHPNLFPWFGLKQVFTTPFGGTAENVHYVCTDCGSRPQLPTFLLCSCCPSHLSVAHGMPAVSSALQGLHGGNPNSANLETIYCMVVLKKMLAVLQ